MTPSGIEPATFRFVAQHLNHCSSAVPPVLHVIKVNLFTSATNFHCFAFVGPCIEIYFYSKTNQMHNISNLFYFGTTLYMFRIVTPSIIRSLSMYIQHQVLLLLASKQQQNLMLYVQS